ncbi:MAG: hypothetical protein QXP91_12795 [Candidatus Methanomethylicia archaeon]
MHNTAVKPGKLDTLPKSWRLKKGRLRVRARSLPVRKHNTIEYALNLEG